MRTKALRFGTYVGGLTVVAVLLLLAPTSAKTTGTHSIVSPDTDGEVGTSTSLALDASGHPVIAYYDTTNQDLKLLHCGDPNCASGNSVTSPDTQGNVGQFASLALDTAGYPVVSYRDSDNEDLKLLHCNDPNCAGGDESITSPDSEGVVGTFSSLVLDAQGFPVVTYRNAPDPDLKLMHCNDANCAGDDESIEFPDTLGAVGSYTSIELDALGNPVVSYRDSTNHTLRVLHCDDPNCSGENESISTPDTSGDVGFWTSMALDSEGHPVVSYYDRTNTSLKLLRCLDPDCASESSIVSPDTDGNVGGWSSLALDGAKRPVVSYFDGITGDLKVLRCGNQSCSANNSITFVDTETKVGTYASLVLDSDGFPVVAYFDSANGDLKLLHCSDAMCAAKPVETPTVEPPDSVHGDANCNDVVDSIDAAIILQWNAGLLESLVCAERADTNKNGAVDSIDAALVLQFTAQLLSSLPP